MVKKNLIPTQVKDLEKDRVPIYGLYTSVSPEPVTEIATGAAHQCINSQEIMLEIIMWGTRYGTDEHNQEYKTLVQSEPKTNHYHM